MALNTSSDAAFRGFSGFLSPAFRMADTAECPLVVWLPPTMSM